MTTKQEVLRDKLADYLAADKAGKGEILTQLEATIHMNRQAIIRRLNQLAVRDPGWEKHRSARPTATGTEYCRRTGIREVPCDRGA